MDRHARRAQEAVFRRQQKRRRSERKRLLSLPRQEQERLAVRALLAFMKRLGRRETPGAFGAPWLFESRRPSKSNRASGWLAWLAWLAWLFRALGLNGVASP